MTIIEELKSRQGICLRCGECCWNFSLRSPIFSEIFPEGEKPLKTNCPFLIPARIEGGKWTLATCKIHGSPERPLVCQLAHWGPPGKPCEIGRGKWLLRKEKHPEIALPDEVIPYI